MNQRQIEILELFTDAANYARHDRIPKLGGIKFPKYVEVYEEKWSNEPLNEKFTVPNVTNSELYDIHLQLQLQNNPRIKSKCR